MRTLPSLAAAAALATLAALPSPSKACGPVTPRAFRVAQHGGHSFAVLERATPPAKTQWTRLEQYSYDATATADAPDLDVDMTLTVLGPDSPARVVTGRDRVFVRNAWDVRGTATALDVRAPNAVVAFSGRHADAKWIALGNDGEGTRADHQWLIEHYADTQLVTSRKLPGTRIDFITRFEDGGKTQTFVRDGGELVERVQGTPYGVVTMSGARYLLVDSGDAISPILI